MITDTCARGFALTEGLRNAVEREAAEFQRCFPRRLGPISVRLFDINGSSRGGADKGCLIHARLGGQRVSLVATAVDGDLYRAITAAFEKLMRGARTAELRTRSLRRRPGKAMAGMRRPDPAAAPAGAL
jgi:ribosome-associated translation inhibitor RaiA